MPTYRFTGYGPDGEQVRGRRKAADEEALLVELDADHLDVDPDTIRRDWLALDLTYYRELSLKDLSFFTSQLASLTRSNLSASQALDILHSQIGTAQLRSIVLSLAREVRTGVELNAAMRSHPKAFPRYYVEMVTIGERTGRLPTFLTQLANMLKRNDTLRRRLMKASSYPAFVVLSSIFILVYLVSSVLPELTRVFRDTSFTLPSTTLFLIGVADFGSRYGDFLFYGLCALMIGLPLALTRDPIRYQFDRWALRIPIIGPILHMGAMAQFCRSMGTALESDLRPLNALTLAAETVSNRYVASALKSCVHQHARGETLSAALNDADVVDERVRVAAHVGERGGCLEENMKAVAEEYEEIVAFRVDTAGELLVPVLIAVAGFVVAVLVLGAYLPMLSMVKAAGAM